MEKPTASPPGTSSLPLGRKLFFAAVLSVLALTALVLAVELGLRGVGYGYSHQFHRLAKLADGTRVWRENRWCTAPYFSPSLVRRPVPFRIPVDKPAKTYRVFVLGSSAAMGDPEPSFSLARMLEFMLTDAYPTIRFEIINAAVTAVNSHVVRGIAEDCAQLEPDLFVVYEGHNEVIGPFGPAGVFAPFLRSELAIRMLVWLKGTRTGQALAAIGRGATETTDAEWGGMQMFLEQQIAAEDSRLDTVRANFRANLQAIAASADSVGARTLLCTVVTNQRDFAPFLSRHRPDLAPTDLARWEAHLVSAQAAERAGNLAVAESEYRAALAIDDHHAELVFRLGRLLLRAGHRPESQTMLSRALDLDTLRFRADARLNQTIRELGRDASRRVDVVDLAGSFASRADGGLPGDEFLYEHVHFNFRGTYEAAKDLFVHVSADLARRHLISDAIATPFSYDDARSRLGYTAHDQAMIALELVNRFQSPPFTGQADQAYRLRTWQGIAQRASALLARPEAVEALRESYRRALAAAPADWMLARNAGAMLVAHQAPAEAVPLLEQAAAWIDDDVDTIVALGWALRATGRTSEAEAAFTRARQLEPRYPNLPTAPANENR